MPKLSSILLVDDDTTTNFLNQLLLQRLEVAEHLLVAENGIEALQTVVGTCSAPVTPRCPALILLDVNMPIMNGIEFMEAYQQLPLAQKHATVVVMLTTSLHARDLERIRQLPIAGVINKPLTKEKMLDLLQAHFPQ